MRTIIITLIFTSLISGCSGILLESHAEDMNCDQLMREISRYSRIEKDAKKAGNEEKANMAGEQKSKLLNLSVNKGCVKFQIR